MVNVPVLSVQSTSIAPRFWMALSRLTMTFFLPMATAPFDRHTVTIIGSISGVSPTATATAKKNAWVQLPLVNPLMTNTSGTITNMNRISSHVNREMSAIERGLGDGLHGNRFGHPAEVSVLACRDRPPPSPSRSPRWCREMRS